MEDKSAEYILIKELDNTWKDVGLILVHPVLADRLIKGGTIMDIYNSDTNTFGYYYKGIKVYITASHLKENEVYAI